MLVTEFGVLLVALGARRSSSGTAQFAASAFTWLATAVGIGLMGIVPASGRQPHATPTRRTAAPSALIRRLEALSGKLSGGLDAVGIAEQVMAEADSVVPTRSAGVFVRSARRVRSPRCATPRGPLPGADGRGPRTLCRAVLGVRGA